MRRVLSAVLCGLLAGSPCLAAELRELPAARVETPVAPQNTGLTLLPALTSPVLPPVVSLPELKAPQNSAAPEVESAKTALTSLSAAKSPEAAAPIVFDAAASAGPSLAAEPASPVAPPTSIAPGGARLAASKPGRRVPRGLVAAGIVASALAPILYKAQPPLMLVYTVAAAFAIVGITKAISATARAVARRVAPRRQPARAPPKHGFWATVAFRLLFGLAVGAAPSVWTAQIVETGARIVVPSREIRRLGTGFAGDVAAVLARNPEGSRLLDRLRDRGGAVRLPDFYVGRLDDASGFSFPLLDAVFIDPARITAQGWTVAEFLSDPQKQREFITNNDELIFHETFHAGQFRRPVQPGQFERFPRQLFSFLTYELEYEDYLATQFYAHERLKADPHAAMEDLGDYENFLDDMNAFIHKIDGTQTYRLFSHVSSNRYEELLAQARERHAALRAEGYHLLALRNSGDPAKAKEFEDKAASAKR